MAVRCSFWLLLHLCLLSPIQRYSSPNFINSGLGFSYANHCLNIYKVYQQKPKLSLFVNHGAHGVHFVPWCGLPIIRTSHPVRRNKFKFLASRIKYYTNNTASFNLSVISIEFLTSWDVNLNPGPANNTSHKPATLKCFSANIQSIKSFVKTSDCPSKVCKLSLFQKFVYSENFDVVALTETWLTNSVSDNEILDVGYSIYRSDRSTGKRGGGVLLAVKNSIQSYRRQDLEPDYSEMVTIEIVQDDGPKFIVSVVYRTPNSNFQTFITVFKSFLAKSSELSTTKLLILGDFNFPTIDWSKRNESCKADEFSFCEVLKDFFLSQVNMHPTRNANILDLIISNEPDSIHNIETIDESVLPFPTDHIPLTFNIILRIPRLTKQSRYVYNFRKTDFEIFNKKLRDANLTDLISTNLTVKQDFENWYFKLMSLVDEFVPKVKIRDINSPPWIDGQVIHLLRKKNDARNKAKKTSSDYYHKKFCALRRECKSLINNNYNDYINSLQASLHENPKRFWSYYRSKRKVTSVPATVKYCDQSFCTPARQAEAFNKYFFNVFSPDPPSCENPIMSTLSNSDAMLSSISLTVSEVELLLRGLNVNKAYGPDSLPTRILVECSSELAPSVCTLFNKSLSSGVLPELWKEALVIPIHKKGDKELVENYRPISLLCILSKVLERCIFNRLIKHLSSSLSSWQHGFLSGRSTVTQMLCFLHRIGQALDNSLQSEIVYLDLSKAFDTVSHSLLLQKLAAAGVNGSLFQWFNDYLTNRSQKVLIKGATSSSLPVLSGVPQGSILGPLLFLWYINDLPDELSSSTLAFLFADDTKLVRIIHSESDMTTFQQDIDKVFHWSTKWRMKFNLDKCEAVRVTRKKSPIQGTFNIGNYVVSQTDTQKDLGVVVNNNLKWSSHIISTSSKANQILGFLYRSSDPHFRTSVKRSLYLSLVRSYLGYASEVWTPLHIGGLRIIEGVQRRATKYILGYPDALIPYKERLIKLNLLPVSYWHEIRDLVFFFKVINGIYNIDITEFVQPKIIIRSTRHSCSLDYQPLKCRTSLFQRSYFNRTVKLWNSLSSSIRTLPSVNAFKAALVKHYKKALIETFDQDNVYTWKSLCPKCYSIRNLSSFRQCCL